MKTRQRIGCASIMQQRQSKQQLTVGHKLFAQPLLDRLDACCTRAELGEV